MPIGVLCPFRSVGEAVKKNVFAMRLHRGVPVYFIFPPFHMNMGGEVRTKKKKNRYSLRSNFEGSGEGSRAGVVPREYMKQREGERGNTVCVDKVCSVGY